MCHYRLIQYLSYNTKEIQMMFVSLLFDIIVAIQYYRDSTDGCVITIWYDTCHTILQRFEWCLCHYYLIQYLPCNTTQILLMNGSLLFDTILAIKCYRDSNDACVITVWYTTCLIKLEIRLMNWSLPFDTILVIQYYRDSNDACVITVWCNTYHIILQRFDWWMDHYRLI